MVKKPFGQDLAELSIRRLTKAIELISTGEGDEGIYIIQDVAHCILYMLKRERDSLLKEIASLKGAK